VTGPTPSDLILDGEDEDATQSLLSFSFTYVLNHNPSITFNIPKLKPEHDRRPSTDKPHDVSADSRVP
jgi:hypothetical protein